MAEYDFKWGASAWGLEFFTPNDVEAFRRTAEQIVKLPFPSRASIIEVFASMSEEGHAENLKAAREMWKIARDLGLRIHGCGFNSYYADKEGKVPGHHLTHVESEKRVAAIDAVKRGFEHCAALANPREGIFIGPWHTRHQHLYVLREEEHELLLDILGDKIVPFAKEFEVIGAFEPLRSHEQCLIMPGREAIGVAKKVNSKYIGINGDTVHWAYAEGNLVKSLGELARSGYLADLHLSEHGRGEWGTGDIGSRTKLIFDALSAANYRGPVVLENFCRELHPLLNIHRPNRYSDGRIKTPFDVLRDGAQYITDALS